MRDLHLNLFYSYNRDTELIENNLTRALIVTLSGISRNTKAAFFKHLFEGSVKSFFAQGNEVWQILADAEFSLQSNIDESQVANCQRKAVLTIASDYFLINEPLEEDTQDNISEISANPYLGSIPDAWIYNFEAGYCILIEVKVGNNPVSSEQVIAHFSGWFDAPPSEIEEYLVSITWLDVVIALSKIHASVQSAELPSNDQESFLLSQLSEFLAIFGYKVLSFGY